MKNDRNKAAKTEMRSQRNSKGSPVRSTLDAKVLRWMWLLPVMAVVVFGIVYVALEHRVLFRIQELNLFLYTPLFLKQSMVVSGGFLSWLGSYFQQYLYHPWLGVALLCLMWIVIMALEKVAFRLSPKWAMVALGTVALLAVINLDMGYWIYYIKLRGWFFAATIGVLLMLASILVYSLLPRRWFVRTAWLIVSTVFGYMLLGIYGLFATLLMIVVAWREAEGRRLHTVVDTVLGVVAIVATPIVLYWLYYYQTAFDNIFVTGLPVYKIMESYPVYYVPYIIIGVVLLLMAIFGGRDKQRPVRTLPFVGINVVLLAVIVFGLAKGWYRDVNYRTEITMMEQEESLDWEGALQTLNDATYAYENAHPGERYEPTRAIWMMKNLALFRLGRAGDEMYHYRDGAKAVNAPFQVRMTQTGGKLLYLNYGMINYCYRWCNEDGVEFGWKVDYFKYMVKTALINGEYTVAKKIIDLLKDTKFYASWASGYEMFLNHPERVRKDKEMGFVFNFKDDANVTTSDNTLVELFLLNHFAYTTSNNPVHQECCLLAALQTKDIRTFWSQFFPYARLHQGKHIPVHYQEAAYLYGHLENKVDISKMPFDKQVVDSYQQFMQAVQTECQGMTEEQIKPILFDRFGSTFYYDYFLIRGMQSY